MLLLGGVLVLAPSTLFVNSRACFSLKHGKNISRFTSKWIALCMVFSVTCITVSFTLF